MSGLSGRCLCGAIRYTTTAEPLRATHCHCSMCRRASGSAFATWVTFRSDAVVFQGPEPERFRSSKWASRGFCPACGSQMTMQFDREVGYLDLAIGTLDEP